MKCAGVLILQDLEAMSCEYLIVINTIVFSHPSIQHSPHLQACSSCKTSKP